MAAMAVVSSLVNLCLRAVVKNIRTHENGIFFMPRDIKVRLLELMCTRGLLNDGNIEKVMDSSIRELDLSECSITDHGMQKLCVCKGLEKIDLNCTKGCREEISSKAIQRLSSNCQMLKVVYLRKCYPVDDRSIQALAANCQYLAQLNVAGCQKITDASLEALATYSHYLEHLNLSRTQITDKGASILSSGVCAASLKELLISHCLHITTLGVEELAVGCKNLEIFIFHGCPLATSVSSLVMSRHMKQFSWTAF